MPPGRLVNIYKHSNILGHWDCYACLDLIQRTRVGLGPGKFGVFACMWLLRGTSDVSLAVIPEFNRTQNSKTPGENGPIFRCPASRLEPVYMATAPWRDEHRKIWGCSHLTWGECGQREGTHPHLMEDVNLEEQMDFFLGHVDSFLKKTLLFSSIQSRSYQLKW